MRHHSRNGPPALVTGTEHWLVFQVFLHAEWAPDDGDGAAETEWDAEDEEEAAKACGKQILELLEYGKALPPPAWQVASEDGSIAAHLRRELLGGGAAARAHSLLRPCWWLELSPNRKALAVVHDTGVTIFSSADEFSEPKCEWEAPLSDSNVPGSAGQWRRVAWNEDATVLAVSDASGSAILLATASARPLARIAALLPSRTPAVAISFLQSTPAGENAIQQHELVALSYDGMLYHHPFTIPHQPGAAAPSKPPLNLRAHHTNVSCLAVHHGTGMIAIGGWDPPLVGAAHSASLSLWRPCSQSDNDAGFETVMAVGPESDGSGDAPRARRGVLERIMAAVSSGRWDLASVVSKLAFSPSGRFLAALQVSGDLLVLDCTARKVRRRVAAAELMLSDAAGSEPRDERLRRWMGAVSDVAFWDEESLLLARRDGRLTVSVVGDASLCNAMRSALGGELLPRFHLAPCVTPALSADEGGALVLECRRRWAPGGGEAVGDAFGGGVIQPWYGRLLGGALGGGKRVSTGGRFARRFLLSSVCCSTVGRVVERKIARGAYEDAARVAAANGLSTDAVYKSQWSAAEVSEESIAALLARVEDSAWVLAECRWRLPPGAAAMRALARFGLERCARAAADCCALDDRARAAALAEQVEETARMLRTQEERLDVYEMLFPGEGIDARRFRWFAEHPVRQVALLRTPPPLVLIGHAASLTPY